MRQDKVVRAGERELTGDESSLPHERMAAHAEHRPGREDQLPRHEDLVELVPLLGTMVLNPIEHVFRIGSETRDRDVGAPGDLHHAARGVLRQYRTHRAAVAGHEELVRVDRHDPVRRVALHCRPEA